MTSKQQYRALLLKHRKALKLAKSKISQYKTIKGQKAQLARVNLLAKKQYDIRKAKFPVLEKFNQVLTQNKITRLVKRDASSAKQYKAYVQNNLNKLYRQIQRAEAQGVTLNLKKISFKAYGGTSTLQGLLNWFTYDVAETSPEYIEREAIFQRILKALKKTDYSNTANKKYSPQFSLGELTDIDAIKSMHFKDYAAFDFANRVFDLEKINYDIFTLYIYFISQKMVLVDIENNLPQATTDAALSRLKEYINVTFDDVRIDINDFIKKNKQKS